MVLEKTLESPLDCKEIKRVNPLHQVAKYQNISFNINPSNEFSGLISFRIDWLDHFAVERTLQSFLQYHSSKASILQHTVFLIVQLYHPYMTRGKTIALMRQTFVGQSKASAF